MAPLDGPVEVVVVVVEVGAGTVVVVDVVVDVVLVVGAVELVVVVVGGAVVVVVLDGAAARAVADVATTGSNRPSRSAVARSIRPVMGSPL
jgi:hypothetical protein